MSLEEKKASKMKDKTNNVRTAFNLPESESCIQDYLCSLNGHSGRMYITANYIGWIPGVGLVADDVLIPFRKIKLMTKERHALFFDNSMNINTHDGATFYFTSFIHRDEVFNLLNYLLNHPPSYIDIEEEEETPKPTPTPNPIPAKNESNNQKVNNNSPNSQKLTQSTDRNSRASSGTYSVGGGQYDPSQDELRGGSEFTPTFAPSQTGQKYHVDTKSTKNALRLAHEAREMGTATLVELTIQAESIDRSENNIEEIHANLDKSSRLLRGIESVGGSIANAMSKDTSNVVSRNNVDRSLKVVKELPPVDFEILEKLKDDFLQPALLRLFEDRFTVADVNTKKPKEGRIWTYEKIDSLVLRARHQHLDIRFKPDPKNPGPQRFRLCTSYIQLVVNEFTMRTPPKQIQVIFEPGTRKFTYGRASLLTSNQEKKEEKKDERGVTSGGFFRRNNASTTKLTKTVLKDVDDETKQQLQEQEDDLDEISHVVGDLTAIAAVMGNELDRQNQQLDRLDARVDSANEKLYSTNRRIGDLL